MCIRDRQMTVWDTTQAPIPIRNGLAAMLGLSEKQVRVIAPVSYTHLTLPTSDLV